MTVVKTVQICTAGECDGECYACRSKEFYRQTEEMKDVLRLAYRALTDGLDGIPSEIFRRAGGSKLRVEAKRRIREILGEGVNALGRSD